MLSSALHRHWQLLTVLVVVIALWLSLVFYSTPAQAAINDDRFDGNMFVIYANNGSLVPAKENLATALERNKPSLLAFYLDDSSDCKAEAIIISQLQAYYIRQVNFIPVNVDTIAGDLTYSPTEAPYYYRGGIPQIVVIDESGKVVFDQVGFTEFETVDAPLRQLFDLPPRSEPLNLQRPEFSPSPSADTTFWTAPVRGLE